MAADGSLSNQVPDPNTIPDPHIFDIIPTISYLQTLLIHPNIRSLINHKTNKNTHDILNYYSRYFNNLVNQLTRDKVFDLLQTHPPRIPAAIPILSQFYFPNRRAQQADAQSNERYQPPIRQNGTGTDKVCMIHPRLIQYNERCCNSAFLVVAFPFYAPQPGFMCTVPVIRVDDQINELPELTPQTDLDIDTLFLEDSLLGGQHHRTEGEGQDSPENNPT